ncbi:MAG: hypothetical protein ACYC5K_12750 [Saccharofermentanales bacterium]
MKYLNQLEWLIRTKTRYSGDRLYVKKISSDDECHRVEMDESLEHERARVVCKKFLEVICFGNDVKANGFSISDNNRKEFNALLISLYRNEMEFHKTRRLAGIRQAAANGSYHGRQRILIDDTLAIEVISAFRRHKITEAEALNRLGISRSTFFRRLKECKGKL